MELTCILKIDDLQVALQQFMTSIQPIVGKLVIAAEDVSDETPSRSSIEVNSNAKKRNSNLEDVEGLRNMVEELKDNVQKSQEATAKIRREKNELLMKVSKALADVKERDDRIVNLEKEKLEKQALTTPTTPIPALGTVFSELSTVDSVPPPPPPPPPSVSMSLIDKDEDQLYPIIKRRNLIKRDSSHRSSRYLHPLALNLCFPNLKSLHENTTNAPSAELGFRTSEQSDILKKPSAIVMKQFFWSKLPMDKIENTVWHEIKPGTAVYNESTSSSSSNSGSSSEDEEEATTPTITSLQLDTVELERLFKKGINQSLQQKNQHRVATRKQNMVTLLEFNRANNIAIMLAKIKLPYPDIRDAIWNIDDNSLSPENLAAIRQYIPTKEEIEIVKEYTGDIDMLGSAERYFRSVNQEPKLKDLHCLFISHIFFVDHVYSKTG